MNARNLIHAMAVVLYAATALCSQAQTVLTSGLHSPRAGDRLLKHEAVLPSVGPQGKDVVWDFSGIDVSDDAQTTMYYVTGTDTLQAADGRNATCLVLVGNSLGIASVENRLLKLSFTSPVLEMPYPLAYGDSVSSSFRGMGVYCDNRRLSVEGTSAVKADAAGCLLLPGGLRLDSVLRIAVERRAVVRMSVDTTRLDSLEGRTVVESRHIWYAPGYRYPLLEAVTLTTYRGRKAVASRSYALITPPDGIDAPSDMGNEAIRRRAAADASAGGNGETPPTDVITGRSVAVNGSTVTVDYALSRTVDVSLLVADVSGVVHKSMSLRGESAGPHTADIHCGSLRPGEYILYIKADDCTTADKFSLKP